MIIKPLFPLAVALATHFDFKSFLSRPFLVFDRSFFTARVFLVKIVLYGEVFTIKCGLLAISLTNNLINQINVTK